MIALALNNINKFYGGTKVLDNITFEINEGDKVGIVGKNGAEKSTLLKLIMGIEGEYEGSIIYKKGIRLGYVDQIPSYNEDLTVLDVLNTAFEEHSNILNQMKILEKDLAHLVDLNLSKALNKYSSLQEQYEQMGGYEIEERMNKVCVGLDFSQTFKERGFTSLSGGEKTSVLLGKLLLQTPDILLLDEPSNHLDLKSIEWLENYLREYKGTVVIVSHDRYFLDKVSSKIIEIEDMKSKTYLGNYTNYVNQKKTDLLLKQQSYNNQQKKINSMEESIKRLRIWGAIGDNESLYKKAASMEKRLDKMDKIDRPKSNEESIKLNIQNSERSGKDVVILNDGYKTFGDKVILQKANFHLINGEKVALIGNNGCGKSTLIKIILSEYSLDGGHIHLGSSLKIGYLPQNITFSDENITVLECFKENIWLTEGKAREYLSKFLFFGESVFKKVKSLSGGERSRLALAKLLFHEVNLLILDEPTNHLDIPSREALEETLREFKGSILFVSHDRYFINSLCHKIVELKDGNLIPYEGNYEYYKEKCLEPLSMDKPLFKVDKVASHNKKPKINSNKINTEKKIKTLEEKIDYIEKEIKNIEEEMNLCNDYGKLNAFYNKKEDLSLKLEYLLEEWMELQK